MERKLAALAAAYGAAVVGVARAVGMDVHETVEAAINDMIDPEEQHMEQKHRLKEDVPDLFIPDLMLEATYADEIAAFKAGQQEATERLKNCLNCKKRIRCKLWHMVSRLPVEDTVNYHCVCKDKWELAKDCKEK